MNRPIFGLLSACLLWTTWGEQGLAAITTLRHYRLGENDLPTPTSGTPGRQLTVDSVSGVNAEKVGFSTYGDNPLVPDSSLAMQFMNVDSRYEAPAELVDDNFGIEAYITPNQFGPVLDGRPFYNGDHAFPMDVHTRGYGLIIADGKYQGLFGSGAVGGVELGRIDTNVIAAPGVTVRMALVRDNGLTSVYVDEVVTPFLVTSAPTPPHIGDLLSIGNFFHGGPDVPFAGVVDEARIFTFAPGAFNPPGEGLLNPPGSDLLPASRAVLGDFTGDRVVDGADLAAWKTGFGASGNATRLQGDADGDGNVNGADFLTWQRQVGSPPGALAIAAVPEPASLALTACAVALAAIFRRSRIFCRA